MNYSEFKKEVFERANKFFKSKERSLNKDVKTFEDDYIEILRSHTLCILDTETTGLSDDDKLWQISIRVLKDLTEIDHLYETFRPANISELEDIFIDKLGSLDPIPLQKINSFLEKYNNSVIIAHNISFDVPRCESEGIIFPANDYFFDSMFIINNHIASMSKLCVFNNVDCDADQQHDAGYDTRLLRDCIVTWLHNYIKPVKFTIKWLYCLVEYLQEPYKYDDPCNKKQYKNKLTKEQSIEKLKQLGYTIKLNNEYINITESYYKVIITTSICYIDYNYTGEDVCIKCNCSSNLPTISDEQSTIVKAIECNNVTVDAVAGSGKTTTTMFIAQKYSNKKILLLTYNKQLQLDSQIKCSSFKNIDVYTFHGFCGYIYKTICHNDTQMYKLIKINPVRNIQYDIIIVDEAQDLVDAYYQFVKTIEKFNSIKHTLMLIGDKYQNIYKFNGASTKYLEFPEKYFDKSFKHLTLQMSYRLTNQMSNWLNNEVMHQQRIKTCKNGDPVTIVFETNKYRSFHKAAKYFNDKITELYNNGVDVNNIMILCYSVRSSSVVKCVNEIKKITNFDVYVPMNDDYPINRDCCKDKILISSIHQSKGIERDYVFVFQFDTSYCYAFKEYLTELNNLYYVALTRAKKKLTVFIRNISVYDMIIEPFSFLTFNENNYVEYINKIKSFKPLLTEKMIISNELKNVTDVCKFIKSDDIEKINKLITIKKLHTKLIDIDIPATINSEEVSEISGNAVTAFISMKQGKNYASEIIDTCKHIQKCINRFDNNIFTLNKNQYCDVSDILGEVTEMSISQLLKLMTFKDYANNYEIKQRGFAHKPLQLGQSKFNWITEDDLNLMISIAEVNLKNNGLTLKGQYEKYIRANLQEHNNKTLWRNEILLNNVYNIAGIHGRIDLFTNNTIVEFKLVNELTINHICQAILYALMNGQSKSILYNIKTGEMIEIHCNDEINFIKILLNKFIEEF